MGTALSIYKTQQYFNTERYEKIELFLDAFIEWKVSKLGSHFLDFLTLFPFPAMDDHGIFKTIMEGQSHTPIEVIALLLELFNDEGEFCDRIHSLTETWSNTSNLLFFFVIHSVFVVENTGPQYNLHPWRRFWWKLIQSQIFSEFLQAAIQSEGDKEFKVDMFLWILQHFCIRRAGYVKNKGSVFDLKFLIPLFDDWTTPLTKRDNVRHMVRIIFDLRKDSSWKEIRSTFPKKLVDMMSNFGEMPLVCVKPTRFEKFCAWEKSEDGAVSQLYMIMADIFARHSKKRYQNWACVCVCCYKIMGSKETCCGGCKMVRYCSRECQTKDWKHHKEFCTRIRKIRRI